MWLTSCFSQLLKMIVCTRRVIHVHKYNYKWTKDNFPVQLRYGYEITTELPKGTEATPVLFTVLSSTPNTEPVTKQAFSTVILTE